jgi:hypothetical protein
MITEQGLLITVDHELDVVVITNNKHHTLSRNT